MRAPSTILQLRLSSTLFMASLCLLTGCYETTSTQRGYVEQKVHCQELATLKMGQIMPLEATEEKDQQTALVAEFKDCMGKNGWAVTGPDKNKLKEEAAASAVPAQVAVAPLAPPVDTLRIKRAAECAYARQAAENSSNARVIAEACEMECRHMRTMSPDAPMPAACPP